MPIVRAGLPEPPVKSIENYKRCKKQTHTVSTRHIKQSKKLLFLAKKSNLLTCKVTTNYLSYQETAVVGPKKQFASKVTANDSF